MSKIASKPIELSSGVKFNIVDNLVSIEGPKGKLEFTKTQMSILSKLTTWLKWVQIQAQLQWGTTRALLFNMINGYLKAGRKN